MFQDQNPNKTPRSNQWQLTLILSALCLILFSLFLTSSSAKSQSYSKFINLVESDRLGPIAFEKVQQQYLEGMTNPRRQVSQKVAEEIDLEVKAVIDGAHQTAKTTLLENRGLLTALAQILLKQEILAGEQLRSHLGQAQRNVDVDKWLQTGKFAQNNLLAPALSNNGKALKR